LLHAELRHCGLDDAPKAPKAQTSPLTERSPPASRLKIGVPVPFSHTMPAPVDVAIVPSGFLDSRRSKLLPNTASPEYVVLA
jgi:hypothetical protein